MNTNSKQTPQSKREQQAQNERVLHRTNFVYTKRKIDQIELDQQAKNSLNEYHKQIDHLKTEEELLRKQLPEKLGEKYYTLLAEKRTLDFYEVISQQAWKDRDSPEVENFIICQIITGNKYLEGFLELGLYDAFKAFIKKTYDEEIWDIKVSKIQLILQCLSIICADNEKLVKALDSQILERISYLPVNVFNKESLHLIFGLIWRLVNCQESFKDRYKGKQSLFQDHWFQDLIKVLLTQTINELVAINASEMLETLVQQDLLGYYNPMWENLNEKQSYSRIESIQVPMMLNIDINKILLKIPFQKKYICCIPKSTNPQLQIYIQNNDLDSSMFSNIFIQTDNQKFIVIIWIRQSLLQICFI
ncbi:hypothetical protein pb186bvf_011663 [Paramecium bursaria]